MQRELVVDCLPFLGMIVVSVVVLRLLVWVSGARLQWAQLARLHTDEKGAVQSLSFVLTLPVFIMVMVLIVQLSQLTMARLIVEYAAYAAARSAVVWIPTDVGEDFEAENRISALRYVGYVEDEEAVIYSRFEVQSESTKFNKIHLAASMALMSICPSRDGVASESHPGNAAYDSLERAYLAMDSEAIENGRIAARIRNKLAFALENTRVDIEVRHKDTEPPLQVAHDKAPWLDEFADNEIGFQDQILVTVSHNFALLPGPGRILSRPPVNANGAQPDSLSASIQSSNGVYVYPLRATARLNNEGEKSVLPFLERLY